MQTINIQELGENAPGVIAAAQNPDVFVVDGGKVVAVVSKPRAPANFEQYWQWREKMLEHVVAAPDWDSTQAVSDDRDRG